MVSAGGFSPDDVIAVPVPVDPGDPRLGLVMVHHHLWEVHTSQARQLCEVIHMLVERGVLLPGPQYQEMLRYGRTAVAGAVPAGGKGAANGASTGEASASEKGATKPRNRRGPRRMKS